MQMIPFSNGDAMPGLGLGTWKSAPGDARRAVGEALRMGYRHIDCAKIYGNEREIGEALADCFRSGVVAREEVWITSKLWNDAHAPADVQPALEQTLRDLQLDHLDLYLIHWPVAHAPGVMIPETPEQFVDPAELPLGVTWEAMCAVAETGLTRHVGVSNCSVSKLRALLASGLPAPEMNQIELHPYLQQPDQLAFSREQGIGLTAYSPLGSPDRPDHTKPADEPVLLEDPNIAAIAARHAATPAQVLIAWALARGTAVIPKSVHPGRMLENLRASELELDAGELEAIGALDRARRYIDGSFWERPGGPYTKAFLWDA